MVSVWKGRAIVAPMAVALLVTTSRASAKLTLGSTDAAFVAEYSSCLAEIHTRRSSVRFSGKGRVRLRAIDDDERL